MMELSQLHRLNTTGQKNVNKELGWMLREAIMPYFKKLSQHLLAGTEENHAKFC
jgi:hypothetical protein